MVVEGRGKECEKDGGTADTRTSMHGGKLLRSIAATFHFGVGKLVGRGGSIFLDFFFFSWFG